MQYGNQYKEIVENLFGRALIDADGLPHKLVEEAEQRLGITLPLAIREYYFTLGGFLQLNEAHNRLINPGELAFQHEILCFMDENQCVCKWGLRREDLAANDPIVYQVNSLDSLDRFSVDLCLSNFLLLSIYLQAVLGGLPINGAHMNANDVIPTIENSFDKVVENDGLRIWHKNGMLISHLEGDNICICAARSALEFQYLKQTLGFEEQ